jgi:cyclic pyranopterin phosphate synthase
MHVVVEAALGGLLRSEVRLFLRPLVRTSHGSTFVGVGLRNRCTVAPSSSSSSSSSLASRCSFSSSAADKHRLFREQLADLQAEREALFGFTEQERHAWTQSAGGTALVDEEGDDAESFMQAVERARWEMDNDVQTMDRIDSAGVEPEIDEQPALTHISDDGMSVHMVDVGRKEVTRRVAVAQSKVVLPPEVVRALRISSSDNELQGPKGPIFATAELAGIMAAKQTGHLIPLCHPLPLDQVSVRLSLSETDADGARFVSIRCECRTTGKTGVEMEALTGASIAALTVYDMVKAVSHKVRIEGTVLVSKTGGKRDVRPICGQ